MEDEQPLHEVLSLACDDSYEEEAEFCGGGLEGQDAASGHLNELPNCRDFSVAEYKREIMEDRSVAASVVFAAVFADGNEDPFGDSALPQLVVCGSSSGRVSVFKLDSLVKAEAQVGKRLSNTLRQVATPALELTAHEGPVYGVSTFNRGADSLLLSCGDDGRICGWQWSAVEQQLAMEGGAALVTPPSTLELRNDQQRGPRGALAPSPETNAMAADEQRGHLYSAAGDANAYAWDLTTGQRVMTFHGHSAYLHCISARPSHQQVVTGSEDGTARIWDCRTGKECAVFDPWRAAVKKGTLGVGSPWVSCLALDASENWLVCGTGGNSLTLYSLQSCAAALRITTSAAPQALLMQGDEIVAAGAEPIVSHWSMGGRLVSETGCAPASVYSLDTDRLGLTMVAGYGGLVDVHSEFGSHLCTFRCS